MNILHIYSLKSFFYPFIITLKKKIIPKYQNKTSRIDHSRYYTKKWENNSIRNALYIIYTPFHVWTLTECEPKMYHYNYFSNHLTCYFRLRSTLQYNQQYTTLILCISRYRGIWIHAHIEEPPWGSLSL